MTKRTTSSLHVRRKSFRGKSESGIALILTLAILVMVTMLVIAFAVSMRVENTASKNFNDLIKARQLAQAAVDQAVAAIRNATPVVSTTTNYVTAPGVIYTLPVGGSWVPNLLFTGYPAPPLPNTGSVDLNQNNLITGTDYPLGSSHLWVGWSNVTASGTSRVIGRFAYWVDDESAKVNLNVAGARGNDLEGYTPAAIDLPSLHFSSIGVNNDVNNITNYVATVGPLDTIESVKMTTPPLVGPAPGITPATYANNQFYVTVNSTSPDITPWGTKRLNLSNVVANAVNNAAAVTNIAAALTNGNLATWFGGLTFSNKYPNVQQIAANIVDYIQPGAIPTDSGSGPADLTAPSYLGLKQTPYINELVISNTFQVTPTPSGPGEAKLSITSYIIAELWYMYTNATWNPLQNKNPYVFVMAIPNISFSGAVSTNSASPGVANTATISGLANPPAIPSMLPWALGDGNGTYLTISNVYALLPIAINDTNVPVVATLNLGTITAIFTGQKGRIDYAQIPLPKKFLINIPLDGTVASASWAAQCNDPRVKPVSNNWLQNLNGVFSTLGASNSTLDPTVTTPGPTTPIQADGDYSCHIISGSNQQGTMSPGEMAYIHTGIPWRTFWLQPPPTAESGPPDWAVLDLFSATDTTNVIGRLNINSILTNSGPVATLLERGLPLNALLTNNVPAAINYIQANAVKNIYLYAVSPGTSVNPPPTANFSPYSYTMVGEVANTQGLSNTTPGKKRDRETPVRGIANIITTRSDTFTIWAIAQASSGLNTRPAEVKVQAIVQRSVDYTATPPQVSFRTLYYRYIYQ